MFRRFAVLLAAAAAVAMVIIFLTEWAVEAAGAETQVMIRAIAKDAMVIGTKVGGARITVRDLATGAILAQGIQEGTSGNVDLIMKQPRIRGVNVFDAPGTAGFLAKLALEIPTEVVVTAEGPLGSPESLQQSSKTLLLVPGQDVLGDGIILELNGFIVKLLSPGPEAQPVSAGALKVRATVHML
jgi:hypothetical protein